MNAGTKNAAAWACQHGGKPRGARKPRLEAGASASALGTNRASKHVSSASKRELGQVVKPSLRAMVLRCSCVCRPRSVGVLLLYARLEGVEIVHMYRDEEVGGGGCAWVQATGIKIASQSIRSGLARARGLGHMRSRGSRWHGTTATGGRSVSIEAWLEVTAQDNVISGPIYD